MQLGTLRVDHDHHLAELEGHPHVLLFERRIVVREHWCGEDAGFEAVGAGVVENYILDNARTHGFKACVFTAPVFSDDDPTLEEENVRVPFEFCKVVVMIDAQRAELHATAYLDRKG